MPVERRLADRSPLPEWLTFHRGFARESVRIVATGKLSSRRTGRQGRHLRELRPSQNIGDLWHAAAGVLIAWLVLAASATASAQDEGTAAPSTTPSLPAPAPETEQEEEGVVQQERRARPFFLPEPSLTERLLPGASPDLASSVLFPPDAFEGVRRPGRLLQVGKFGISSSIDVAATYDNFNPRNGDSSDGITGNLGAGVRAQSLFERHSLGFGVNASIGNPQRSPGNTTPDRIALTAAADGRLDLTRRSSLTAEASFTRGAQNPEAQEAGAQDEPTIYGASASVGYDQQFDRLGWQVAAGIDRTEADDGEDAGQQDRTSYTVSPGLDYKVSRRLSLFAESGYSLNHYDQSGEGGSRDSQSVRADVGAGFDLGRAFAARIGIGYIRVFFDDSERDDEQSPTFTADLDGAISLDRLTVLSLGLNHSTDLTTADNAALVTRTQFSSSINRLLTPASAILANVNLSRSDFIDAGRTDHDITAQLAYSHTLFRSLALNISYRFSKRLSDNSDDEFNRNIVSVGLSASF